MTISSPAHLLLMKRWRDRKKAEKLAAMTPEQRAKWEASYGHRLSQDKPKNDMPNTETVPQPEIPAPTQPLAEVTALPVTRSNGTKGEGTRLTWNNEERKKLAVAVAAKLRAQGLRHAPTDGDRVGASFLLDAVRAAQHEVFERDRRRSIMGRNALGAKFFAQLEIALTAGVEAEKMVQKIEAEQAAPVQPVAASNAVTAPAMTDEQLVSAGLAKATLAQLTQATMAKLFETIGGYEAAINELRDFNNMLVEENAGTKRHINELHVEITNLRGTAKKRLPVVAICGCQPHIFHHITDGAKTAGIELDFRHYEQGSKARPFHADYAIAMHWLGHDWDDQIHNAVPDRSRAKFIGNGGVGMAIKQLKEWFSHE